MHAGRASEARHHGSESQSTPRMPTSSHFLSQSLHPQPTGAAPPQRDPATGAFMFAVQTSSAVPLHNQEAAAGAQRSGRLGSFRPPPSTRTALSASPTRSAVPSGAMFTFSPSGSPQRNSSAGVQLAAQGAFSGRGDGGASRASVDIQQGGAHSPLRSPPLRSPFALPHVNTSQPLPSRPGSSVSLASHYASPSGMRSPSHSGVHSTGSMTPRSALWWSSLRLGGFIPRNLPSAQQKGSPPRTPLGSAAPTPSAAPSRGTSVAPAGSEAQGGAGGGLFGLISAAFQPKVRGLFGS